MPSWWLRAIRQSSGTGRVAARLHACGLCGEDFERLPVAVRGVTD